MKLVVEEIETSPTQVVSILDALLESVRNTINYNDISSYDLTVTVDLVKHKD